jgi:glycosyltransferase involved in cell wall biosynthesis
MSNSKIKQKKKVIFYIFYDLLNVMPIHTFEVVHQLAHNKWKIYLFGPINSDWKPYKKWQIFDIKLIFIKCIPFRIIREISYLFFLLLKLTIFSIKLKPEIIYIRHGSVSLIGTVIGKIFRLPVCLEINDINTKRTEYKRINFLKKIWIHLIENISFRISDKIITVTDSIREWIIKIYKIDKNHISTIPNGVNPHRFRPNNIKKCRQKFNFPSNAIIVGYLGSLYHWAGIEYLIEASERIILEIPNILFVIGGGEEPYLSQLKKKISKKNLGKYFKFLGSIEWDAASDFINTFDIGIAPAYFNNLESGISSQKVFAYLSCGKPVIGSDIPGLGDMLEKMDVGMSFTMGDSVALSTAIIKLSKDQRQIISMGKKARTFVLNNYSWEILVNRLEKEFQKIILNYSQ